MALTARRRVAALQAEGMGADLEDLGCSTSGRPEPGARGSAPQGGAARRTKAVGQPQEGDRGRPRLQPAFLLASAREAVDSALASVPPWRVLLGNLAAGATAGAAVEAALYPIDTIKTRMQAVSTGGGFRALMQKGEGKALYAGVWGNLAGVIPASAIFMAVYEPVKQRVAKEAPEDRQWLAPLAGGAMAGLAASLVRVPTEVIKQRMQTREFAGAASAVSSILRVEGWRGLYAGYGSFLLRDLPFDAIEFVAYEQLKLVYKRALARRGQARDPNAGETSVLGALAGAITGVATTPLDVIKTRLMTQGATGRYRGVADCATKILREEGTQAFFRGWEPRVVWIGLGGCVFFTVLEEAKKLYAAKEGPLPRKA